MRREGVLVVGGCFDLTVANPGAIAWMGWSALKGAQHKFRDEFPAAKPHGGRPKKVSGHDCGRYCARRLRDRSESIVDRPNGFDRSEERRVGKEWRCRR